MTETVRAAEIKLDVVDRKVKLERRQENKVETKQVQTEILTFTDSLRLPLKLYQVIHWMASPFFFHQGNRKLSSHFLK